MELTAVPVNVIWSGEQESEATPVTLKLIVDPLLPAALTPMNQVLPLHSKLIIKERLAQVAGPINDACQLVVPPNVFAVSDTVPNGANAPLNVTFSVLGTGLTQHETKMELDKDELEDCDKDEPDKDELGDLDELEEDLDELEELESEVFGTEMGLDKDKLGDRDELVGAEDCDKDEPDKDELEDRGKDESGKDELVGVED